ncbi:mobile mystery protein A [Leucothrix arctica]|uniref:Mobile mystery protein A n=1 Tax=Leucothrix arctica TaxID=1481894 RepID=A0A317CF74_9GAMM|nr:mobile mystery protein A [Leucothrix arctica]PWQ97295.1 mobile mystery protein A [Leucothrix arctica]
MSSIFQVLKRQQTEKSLEIWRSTQLSRTPNQGWVRTIREALGMTVDSLAVRLGITPTGVRKVENSEAANTITLKSLMKAAEALDCELRYSLVPKYSLEEMRDRQATRKAKEQIQSIGHSMKLEDQEVDSASQKLLLEELKKSLLEGNGKELWK